MSLEFLEIERVGATFRLAGGVSTPLPHISPCKTSIEILRCFGDIFANAQVGKGPEWLRGANVLVTDPAGVVHSFEPAEHDIAA